MAKDAPPNQAKAAPSKTFFVNMLTRDIELKDTLLDLLDNCVDGILRNTDPDLETDRPFSGYFAEFTIGPDSFELRDNCGGIPIDLAKEKAFAIGRPDTITGDEGIATVGMYGIGMKRAIFKLGRHAIIESWSDSPFEVVIDKRWMASDLWSPLPMTLLTQSKLAERGTRIFVKDLNESVRLEFGVENFISDFTIAISQVYSLIIEKGFSVFVREKNAASRGEAVPPAAFKLLESRETTGDAILPVVFAGNIKGVDIEVIAGLYRELPNEEEREAEEETRGKKDDAGWTVACNDRIVIWKDKSRLTGWGEASVPNFHGQFIAITGIVLLSSKDPHLLPLTTTKSGVDAGSDIFSFAKDMMREATKLLVDFTNKWKRFEEDLESIYKDTEYVGLQAIRESVAMRPSKPWSKMDGIARYWPKLPLPKKEQTSARVSFVAKKSDIAVLSEAYYGQLNIAAKYVGEEAFNRELARHSEVAE